VAFGFGREAVGPSFLLCRPRLPAVVASPGVETLRGSGAAVGRSVGWSYLLSGG